MARYLSSVHTMARHLTSVPCMAYSSFTANPLPVLAKLPKMKLLSPDRHWHESLRSKIDVVPDALGTLSIKLLSESTHLINICWRNWHFLTAG